MYRPHGKRTVVCPVCKRAYQTSHAKTCGREKCRAEMAYRRWLLEQQINGKKPGLWRDGDYEDMH